MNAMESVEIDIDPDKEEMVPRPEATEEMLAETGEILGNAGPLFDRIQEEETSDIVSALTGMEEEDDITPVESDEEEAVDFSEFVPAAGAEADEA